MALQSMSSGMDSSLKFQNSMKKYLLLLFFGKFLKAIGIFLAYDLLKRIDISQFIFFALLLESIVFILLQRPLKPANCLRLGKIQYIRLIKYTFIEISIEYMWLFGLTLCGPFRATLIFEQSDFVIICALRTIILSQASSPARTRGVIILFIATLIIFGLDFDHIKKRVKLYLIVKKIT